MQIVHEIREGLEPGASQPWRNKVVRHRQAVTFSNNQPGVSQPGRRADNSAQHAVESATPPVLSAVLPNRLPRPLFLCASAIPWRVAPSPRRAAFRIPSSWPAFHGSPAAEFMGPQPLKIAQGGFPEQ